MTQDRRRMSVPLGSLRSIVCGLLSVVCAVGALMATVQRGSAAEIKVLTAGAFKQVVLAVLPEFEKSGHKAVVDNDTVGALVKRIEGGEPFDVAVLTPATVDDLTR